MELAHHLENFLRDLNEFNVEEYLYKRNIVIDPYQVSLLNEYQKRKDRLLSALSQSRNKDALIAGKMTLQELITSKLRAKAILSDKVSDLVTIYNHLERIGNADELDSSEGETKSLDVEFI